MWGLAVEEVRSRRWVDTVSHFEVMIDTARRWRTRPGLGLEFILQPTSRT